MRDVWLTGVANFVVGGVTVVEVLLCFTWIVLLEPEKVGVIFDSISFFVVLA